MMNDPLFHIDMTFDGQLPEETIQASVPRKVRGKFPGRTRTEPKAEPAPAMPHTSPDTVSSPQRIEDVPAKQAEMEAEL